MSSKARNYTVVLTDIKQMLLDEPETIVNILENFDFSHIQLKGNEIRCGVSEDNNATSVRIKLINNDNLFVTDYGRNLRYDLFSYIVNVREVKFIEVLNVVKGELHLSSFYEPKKRSVFGGFYDKIKSQDHSLYIKTYEPDVLDSYLRISNRRFLRDNINVDTQDKFNVRYDTESQRIIIPIYDIYGNIIGVKGRANWKISDNENKYLYLIPCAMSQTLYGYHQNYEHLYGNKVYIYEAEKSIMQCDSYGLHNCLSIGGNSLSIQQCKLLTELNPTEIIFMLDKGLERQVLDNNIKTLSAFFRMRNTKIKYWNSEQSNVPNKSSPSDMGKDMLNYIILNQLKEVSV